MQQTQYFFGDTNYVEITDNQGVRTRVQFYIDKPMYAYEIGETDVEFWQDKQYIGTITIYPNEEYLPSVKKSFVQHYYDGENISADNQWGYQLTQDRKVGTHLREEKNLLNEGVASEQHYQAVDTNTDT